MIVVPVFSGLTRPASRSTAKWPESVGLAS